MRRLAAGLALALVSSSAFAQGEAHSTIVDFAPVLNPLIQIVGGILVLAVPALIPAAWKIVAKVLHLQSLRIDQQLQAKIDAEAQKALGGAFSRAVIPGGKLTVDVKSQIIADAGARLVANAGRTLTMLGSKDNEAKAAEIIENRLGLMEATAAGTPIPNPSAAPAAAAPLPAATLAVTPAAKPA